MIRSSLGVLLVLLSLSIVLPQSARYGSTNSGMFGHPALAPSFDPYNPPCPCPAFNVTYSQFDLYTSKNATAPPPNLTFFSTTINNTQTGQPVPATAFKYSIPSATVTAQSINYTLTVPKGTGPATFLKFDWNGTLGQGARARYLVYNASNTPPVLLPNGNVTRSGPPYSFNFTGGPPNSSTGGVPVSCAPTDECYDLTSLIGFKVTLAFLFSNTNATGRGLNVRVANIEVASVANTPSEATLHTMTLTSATQVSHNANVTVTYNATAISSKHLWGQTVTTYYFPKPYTLTGISLNNTIPLSLAYPIAKGSCTASSCSSSQLASLKNTQFIALNDTTTPSSTTTYPWFRGSAIILATGNSGEGFIQTTLGGLPTNFWEPGDLLQVRVNDTQGVNGTGSNIISILSPTPATVNLTQTFSVSHRGLFLFNFTSALPQPPIAGSWNVTSTFTSNFDFGVVFHTFRVEQTQVKPSSFSYSGDNRLLSVKGTLTNSTTQTTIPASNVVGNVFAIDSGSNAAPLSTPTITGGTMKGMYISNVTLLNGAFTIGQPLIATFTLVNPPPTVGVDANITIDHEWSSQQTHGASVTVSLKTLGDQPYLINSKYVYKLTANMTLGGITIVITSLTTGNSVSANIPPGSLGDLPVTSVRQNSGLFKITVTSKPHAQTVASPCAPLLACTNSLESPTYAYILVNPPLPGRLLASTPFPLTDSSGTFTTAMTSGGELGAKNLIFYVLGRDPNGIVITGQDKSTPESTILQASVDSIPTVTQGQSVTIILHLSSNSSIVNMNITVSLNIDQNVVQSQSGIYIQHGAKKDVSFSFNAPQGLGVHTLTFFSPEYGAPIVTGTLQVSVLQNSLQVIIPAIIGLVAAIVILLFYLYRRKPQVEAEPTPKDKPAGGKPSKPTPASPTKSLT